MEYRAIMTENALEHHGILGQKWGVRRYQNEDGSLTPEGRKRYGSSLTKKRERLTDTRDIFRGQEKQSKRLSKPLSILGGAASGLSAANTTYTVAMAPYVNAAIVNGVAPSLVSAASLAQATSIAYGGIVGAAAGGAIYGSYKLAQRTNKLIADRKEMKISEIDKMLEE